jgi:hypothetical protein
MLTVANGYKSGWIGSDVIYIGRESDKLNLDESIFANLYPITEEDTREEVISKYELYLMGRIYKALVSPHEDKLFFDSWNRLIKLYLEDNTYRLTCYCYPKACHGDVILKYIRLYLNLHISQFMDGCRTRELYQHSL